VSYRDRKEATRAEVAELEAELRGAETRVGELTQKLARTEGALRGYRRGSARELGSGVWPAFVAGVSVALVWFASIAAAVADHDELAREFAVASVLLSAFTPLVVWATVGRLPGGLAVLVVKALAGAFLLSVTTMRMPGIDVLFWFGPLYAAVTAGLECSYLGTSS